MISKDKPLKLAASLKTITVGLIVLCSCSGFTISGPATANASFSVPIIVQEALPAAASTKARINSPVTVGIPLSDSDAISNVSQLGISNVSSGQLRIIGRYPSGNAKWVLADFQTDLPAGGINSSFSLTNGTGNFGGSNLAVDSGSTININTGVAQFVIRKANFNIFDSVTVGGKQIIVVGNSGRIEVTGADGITYNSANDSASTAIVEENGPVRTVIKATGVFKSGAGTRLMDYTLRLHFYKGSSKVKSFVELRNALSGSKAAVVFTNIELITPLSIGTQKTVIFSRNADEVSAPLGTGETAYLYQGYNTERSLSNPISDCYRWSPPIPGTCNGSYVFTPDTSYQGLKVQSGSTVLNASGNTAQWTQGYADVSDSAGVGVTVARRWMSSYYPAGFEFKESGSASIELFSKHNGGTQMKLLFGVHDTHEVMWDFHAQSNDRVATLYELQYPILGRAPLSQYKNTKALFGTDEVATPSEQNTFYQDHSRTPPSLANPPFNMVYRVWVWNQPGGSNQTETPLQNLLDYLRTGYGGFYLLGEQRTIWNLDSGTGHSDDYTGYDQSKGFTNPTTPRASYNGSPADMEHALFMSSPFYYFLTGNEQIKDAFLDYGEQLQANNNSGYYAIPSTPFLRAWSHQLRNLALAYEFSCQTGTCNATWKNTIETAIGNHLDSRDDSSGCATSPRGRSLERGYLWWWESSSCPRLVHSFYMTTKYFDAVWHTHRVMESTGWNYARMADLEDYMTGLSKFLFNEYVSPYPASSTDSTTSSMISQGYKYGVEYDYMLDTAPITSSAAIRPYEASNAALWHYQRTGDATILDHAEDMLWEITEYGTPARYASEVAPQRLVWSHFNRSAIPTWQNVPVTTIDNGGGSYTLSWTVPTGATQYQIKYSDKPIIEWLGFNKDTRTYQFSPAQYTAFFAAKNIANNPTPDAAGLTQSITLTGLPVGQKFMMKSFVTTPAPPLKPPAAVINFKNVP